MLKTTTKILGFTLFLLMQAGFAHADQKWVELTVLTGGPGTSTAGYIGLMDSSDYDAITKKLDEQGMVKLTSVYWVGTDGKPIKLKDVQTGGVKEGYTDTAFFRQEYATRIILMDQQYINGLTSNK